jgi:hypothetical protein
MTKSRPPAPLGTYWRAGVLWGRSKTNGREIRWSLHTDNPAVAAVRRRAVLPTDPKVLKAKLAPHLSAEERIFVFDAIYAAIVRSRQGGRAAVAQRRAHSARRGTAEA